MIRGGPLTANHLPPVHSHWPHLHHPFLQHPWYKHWPAAEMWGTVSTTDIWSCWDPQLPARSTSTWLHGRRSWSNQSGTLWRHTRTSDNTAFVCSTGGRGQQISASRWVELTLPSSHILNSSPPVEDHCGVVVDVKEGQLTVLLSQDEKYLQHKNMH